MARHPHRGRTVVHIVIMGCGRVGSTLAHILEDRDNTIAVIDFRVTNPSNGQFVVKNIDVFLDTKDGKQLDSANFAETDSKRMFDYYKVLGKKYNATLLTRDKIEPGQTVDRMIAVRFTVPDAQVGNRKDVRLVIEDLDGLKSQVVERPLP